jgi:hypothetical protein
MKKNILNASLQTGILVGALLLACASAQATGLSISFDGNGHITGNTANWFPSQGDGNPGPIFLGPTTDGLGASYSPETPNGMDLSGDLFIYCDAAHQNLMDILRFTATGQQYISVYSASGLGGTALADKGFTTAFVNSVKADGLPQLSVMAENLGGYAGYVYLPTTGEPAFGGNITYNFTSDELYGSGNWAVPDGGTTVGLLGMGLAGLASLRKWLARA